MDGKGIWVDNVYVERLWRTIKYEMVYLHKFDTILEIKTALKSYITFYNEKRPHQALDYYTPNEMYYKYKNERCKMIELELFAMQNPELS